MPESWPRSLSGYRSTGIQQHRDPVRGFPPTSGTGDPEHPPSHLQGSNGAHPGGYTGPEQDRPAAGWGGGPWETQGTDTGNGHGIGAFAGAVNGSQMPTHGEDGPTQMPTHGEDGPTQMPTHGEDGPTQIWTLGGHADGQRHAPPWKAGSAAPGQARNVRVGSGGNATAAAGPVGHRKARRVRARWRVRPSAVLLVSAVAVVTATALAAVAAWAFTTKHKTAAAPSAAMPAQIQPSLPTPTPSAHLGTWQYITSRADDPVPLALAELFPSQVSAGPRSYLRTTERAGRSCRNAVFGSRLKAALRKGCSQALRASYLAANGARMGTIGVLNLATASAAANVGKVVTAPGQFIQPLPAPHGASGNLGNGTGVVWAVAKGHYLILMWAQYANLHSPTTPGERNFLLQFVNDLYQKTVNQSLTRRMVTGQPLTP